MSQVPLRAEANSANSTWVLGTKLAEGAVHNVVQVGKPLQYYYLIAIDLHQATVYVQLGVFGRD